MTFDVALLLPGIACLLAAVLGGGTSAFHIRFPALLTHAQRGVLAGLGLVFVVLSFGVYLEGRASPRDSPTNAASPSTMDNTGPSRTPNPSPVAAPLQSSSAPQTPSPSPSPSAVALHGLPYQADWSDWALSPGWGISDHMLVSDGSSFGPALGAKAPRLDAPGNYAVDAEIRLDRYTAAGFFGSASFGIALRASGSEDGYGAGHYAFASGPYKAVVWTRNPGSSSSVERGGEPFVPELGQWIHYRVEVRDTTVMLQAGNLVVGPITDNTYLSGTVVGVWSSGAQISVRNLTVSAL